MGESFRDLAVWQRAIELTVEIYKLTAGFPDSERFGLTSQIRRATVSVASNIAEGYGRSTKGEYVLFLGHARGSAAEVETQLVIAKALGYGVPQLLGRSEKLCGEVSRMLHAMLKTLQSKPSRQIPGPSVFSPSVPSPSVPSP